MGSTRTRTRKLTDFERSLLEGLRSENDGDHPLALDVESLETEAEKAKNKDRSVIARWLVLAFIAILLTLVVYVLSVPFTNKGWEEIETVVTFALTITSSVLLPVVTLVLGYYFGTSQSQA